VAVLEFKVRQGPPLKAAVTNVQLEGPLGRGLLHCMNKPASVPSTVLLNPLIAMTAVVKGAGKLTYFMKPGFPSESTGTMLDVMSTSFTYNAVMFVFTVNCMDVS